MPAQVNSAPNRMVHSNMMTANGTSDTTGLPPGLIIGHCAAVSRLVSRKPMVIPVIPPASVHHRTGDGRPSYIDLLDLVARQRRLHLEAHRCRRA
jgi:hypothetical protein